MCLNLLKQSSGLTNRNGIALFYCKKIHNPWIKMHRICCTFPILFSQCSHLRIFFWNFNPVMPPSENAGLLWDALMKEMNWCVWSLKLINDTKEKNSRLSCNLTWTFSFLCISSWLPVKSWTVILVSVWTERRQLLPLCGTGTVNVLQQTFKTVQLHILFGNFVRIEPQPFSWCKSLLRNDWYLPILINSKNTKFTLQNWK